MVIMGKRKDGPVLGRVGPIKPKRLRKVVGESLGTPPKTPAKDNQQKQTVPQSETVKTLQAQRRKRTPKKFFEFYEKLRSPNPKKPRLLPASVQKRKVLAKKTYESNLAEDKERQANIEVVKGLPITSLKKGPTEKNTKRKLATKKDALDSLPKQIKQKKGLEVHDKPLPPSPKKPRLRPVSVKKPKVLAKPNFESNLSEDDDKSIAILEASITKGRPKGLSSISPQKGPVVTSPKKSKVAKKDALDSSPKQGKQKRILEVHDKPLPPSPKKPRLRPDLMKKPKVLAKPNFESNLSEDDDESMAILEASITKGRPKGLSSISPKKGPVETSPKKSKVAKKDALDSSPKQVKLSGNLAKNAKLIEDMLLEDLEENEESAAPAKIVTNPESTGGRKFFQTKTGTKGLEPQHNEGAVLVSKRRSSLFRRTREGSKNKSNVYEFLSQSQVSDSDTRKHQDPAADIIAKLISEGKVVVATTSKKTGKRIIKRKYQRKPKQARVKLTKKEQEAIRMEVLKQQERPEESGKDLEPSTSQMGPPLSPTSTPRPLRRRHEINADGSSFSRLARSVLIQQGKRLDKTAVSRENPPAAVVAAASTPRNPSLPVPSFSPIHNDFMDEEESCHEAVQRSPKPGCTSPWRVTEELHLPSVFHYSGNSSFLPSFSSDFIPPTPRKQRRPPASAEGRSPVSGVPLELDEASVVAAPSDDPEMPRHVEEPAPPMEALSSFSSNDSNAENLPPPVQDSNPNPEDNENLFNLTPKPIPDRTGLKRSPLKAINIIEVVSLPNFKVPSPVEKEAKEAECDTEKDIEKEVEEAECDLEKDIEKDSQKDKNLFGFEEYISDDSEKDDAPVDKTQMSPQDRSRLCDKLKEFRKFIPPEESAEPQDKGTKIARVFDENEGRPRQRCIKEMLCSTMINSPRRTVAPSEDCETDDSQSIARKNSVAGSEFADLFKDPDPESTFDEKTPRRTYVRPYKRKRKLRHNFVMFMDSDESGEEENAATEGDVRTPKPKKQTKKQAKEQEELDLYVEDFQAMCKEVEDFEVWVE